MGTRVFIVKCVPMFEFEDGVKRESLSNSEMKTKCFAELVTLHLANKEYQKAIKIIKLMEEIK